jgi:methionyl-tRNA formyltransferase
MPPVKAVALEHGLSVYQPVKIREQEYVELIRSIQPDVMVVAAFGQILSKELLDIPKYGCINVHASLLPKYRGAAPIQWSILNGDAQTGVTIMRMDAGIDTGDMMLQRAIPIEDTDTADTLFDKLAALGGPMILEVLDQLQAGTATYTPQNESEASHVKMLRKEMGLVDWSRPAVELERMVRGLNSWPCAYTFLEGKALKIYQSRVLKEDALEAKPGQVLQSQGTLKVATGAGTLEILELQLAGKKRMPAGEFLRGYRNLCDTILGQDHE